ncbi:MAG TPA: hypothetical protein VL179_09960, partial [Mycobacterium sp.]|nr:hypothetical protein [Mycobacterium sp.]
EVPVRRPQDERLTMGGHIEIKGADGRVHVIDADRADEFFDGRTGLPTTDDEYDESTWSRISVIWTGSLST